MKKIILFLVILLSIAAAIIAVQESNKSKLETNQIQVKLESKDQKLIQLEKDYNKLDGANAENEQKVQQLEQKRQQLEKEKSDLKAQLQAKAELKQRNLVLAAAAPSVPFTQRHLTGSASKSFIYHHESGNNPGAIASNGACGLGQALPCSKLPCSLSDYACQDKWFTSYMLSRYGTWEHAVEMWKSRASYYSGDWHGGWW